MGPLSANATLSGTLSGYLVRPELRDGPALARSESERTEAGTSVFSRAGLAGMARGIDEVSFSPGARDAGVKDQAGFGSEPEEEQAKPEEAGRPKGRDGEPLDDGEVRQVEQLKARDIEVRKHEEAHKAAAGELFMGGPNYTYQQGPDGMRYAVGGSVQIDTSPGSTPEETIRKAAKIRAAALAPAEPSSTDRSVAAKASRMEAEARAELAKEQAEGTSGEGEGEGEDSGFGAAANTGSGALAEAAIGAYGEQERGREEAGRFIDGFA